MEASGCFGEAESRLDPTGSLHLVQGSFEQGDDVVRLEFGMYSGGSEKGAGSSFGRQEIGG